MHRLDRNLYDQRKQQAEPYPMVRHNNRPRNRMVRDAKNSKQGGDNSCQLDRTIIAYQIFMAKLNCIRKRLAEFARMVERNNGIEKRPTTTRNPQANNIIKRIHRNIGNMIRIFRIGQCSLQVNR